MTLDFHQRRAQRAAFTLTELLVAATLLVSVITVVTQLTLGAGQLRAETRRQTLAQEELVNQLDRLTGAEPAAREAMLRDLQPSPWLVDALPDAQLSAETFRDVDGHRLVLKINWNRRGPAKPLSLTAWLPPGASGDDPPQSVDSADMEAAP